MEARLVDSPAASVLFVAFNQVRRRTPHHRLSPVSHPATPKGVAAKIVMSLITSIDSCLTQFSLLQELLRLLPASLRITAFRTPYRLQEREGAVSHHHNHHRVYRGGFLTTSLYARRPLHKISGGRASDS